MDPKIRMTYNFPTIVRFGAGVIDEVGPHLVEQGLEAPQIVTDPGLSSLPFFTDILDELRKVGLSPEVFSGIDKNPVKKNVLDGVEHFKSTARDSIVGEVSRLLRQWLDGRSPPLSFGVGAYAPRN